jgi:S-formylglutathione hydrolase
LGMHRPDVFSVIYAVSPCCLDAVEEVGNSNHPAWNGVLEFKKYEDVDAALEAGRTWPVVLFGFLAAINPDPTSPLGVTIPVARKVGSKLELLVPLEPAYEEFRLKFPLQQIPAYRDNLSKLTAIGLEYGFDDEFAQVPWSTGAFSKALNDAHIPHTLETYFGGHDRRVSERLATKVFPFLSRNLETLGH